MTPRSLVGMTMGARKRAWLAGRIDSIVFPDGINTDELEMKSAYSWSEIRRWWQPFGWQLLGQRLRPCPNCMQCWPWIQFHNGRIGAVAPPAGAGKRYQRLELYDICDGSGVLPARAKKVRR